MKSIPTLCVLSLTAALLASGSAFAAAAEIVTVNVDFEIAKCTATTQSGGEVATICDSAASMGSNIDIPLTDCETTSNQQGCSGTWSTSQMRDGQEFFASIAVNKWSFDGGRTYEYSLYAMTAPGREPSSNSNYVTVYMTRSGQMTDRLSFRGLSLNMADGVTSYVPSLLIGPKMPYSTLR